MATPADGGGHRCEAAEGSSTPESLVCVGERANGTAAVSASAVPMLHVPGPAVVSDRPPQQQRIGTC